jgi:uncharacterized membrane protein
MTKPSVASWRVDFFAGLAVVLPAVLSVAIIVWLFGTVANITDTLLFFLPTEWTHRNQGQGAIYWYWSLLALLLAVLLIGVIGRFARHYLGQQLVELVDLALLRVPLLNKIYGTIKQVNQAFSPNQKSSFRQVVLVEFPRAGQHSVGFVTGEPGPELRPKIGEKVVSVFIPTTPNITSGFVVLVPEQALTKLDLSVAEGIKYIISLGVVSRDSAAAPAADSGKDNTGGTVKP